MKNSDVCRYQLTNNVTNLQTCHVDDKLFDISLVSRQFKKSLLTHISKAALASVIY